mmetsp:Transcript_15919/g.39815  ORF Transcript_15919/g.39815 Transcript_15919/m.39815 type:complete len:214 (+) Transcript_15919:440-1081(+)
MRLGRRQAAVRRATFSAASSLTSCGATATPLPKSPLASSASPMRWPRRATSASWRGKAARRCSPRLACGWRRPPGSRFLLLPQHNPPRTCQQRRRAAAPSRVAPRPSCTRSGRRSGGFVTAPRSSMPLRSSRSRPRPRRHPSPPGMPPSVPGWAHARPQPPWQPWQQQQQQGQNLHQPQLQLQPQRCAVPLAMPPPAPWGHPAPCFANPVHRL